RTPRSCPCPSGRTRAGPCPPARAGSPASGSASGCCTPRREGPGEWVVRDEEKKTASRENDLLRAARPVAKAVELFRASLPHVDLEEAGRTGEPSVPAQPCGVHAASRFPERCAP